MRPPPRIHQLYEHPLDGAAIEQASLSAVDREAALGGQNFDPDEWRVVRRLIHASADLALAGQVRFSRDAVSSATDALRAKRPLVADSNMIVAGLSLARLRAASVGYDREDIHCFVANADVARESRRSGLPRALFAVRRARPILEGAIVLFGNSPVGLLELNRLVIEDGLRPSLVVGMPVGFVHVEESKDELMSLGVPWIAIAGRRGGSPLAVATIHALCDLAGHGTTIETTDETVGQPVASSASPSIESVAALQAAEAVLLLGHGSRMPNAVDGMEEVAARLRQRRVAAHIELCFMARQGPSLPDAFDRCVAAGARHVLVIPYFLLSGVHIHTDIPRLIAEARARHPQVRLVLGEGLGCDDGLVDVVERRIREARLQ